jgi:hypothetical protein
LFWACLWLHFRRSLLAQPLFRHQSDTAYALELLGTRQYHSVPGQWQLWQLNFMGAFSHVHRALGAVMHIGTPADGVAEAGAAVGSHVQEAASSSSSSSSGSRQGTWWYLVDLVSSHIRGSVNAWQVFESQWQGLQAMQIASEGAAWVPEPDAAFGVRYPAEAAAADPNVQLVGIITSRGSSRSNGGSSSSSNSGSNTGRASGSVAQQPAEQVDVDVGQLYTDAIQFCRAMVAAASLPVVCNNPSCERLDGISEAAAAGKLCAGCRCRYCSAACQAADWRRHKRACKRMSAAGQMCR